MAQYLEGLDVQNISTVDLLMSDDEDAKQSSPKKNTSGRKKIKDPKQTLSKEVSPPQPTPYSEAKPSG
jgi:hypothetical protein